MPELSNCHQAPVTIGGDDSDPLGGTHYYVCSRCHNMCDLMPKPSEAQNTTNDNLPEAELQNNEKMVGEAHSITNDTSSGTEYQNDEIMIHEAQDDELEQILEVVNEAEGVPMYIKDKLLAWSNRRMEEAVKEAEAKARLDEIDKLWKAIEDPNMIFDEVGYAAIRESELKRELKQSGGTVK